MASDWLCKIQVPASESATHRVAASAPHLVLRFQKSAASMTGAMAAKPENAKRIASSKMFSLSCSFKAIR